MDEEKDSTNNVKDPNEELIETIAEKVLEMLVVRGKLLPLIYADGAIKYRISSKLDRLATANRRRRD